MTKKIIFFDDNLSIKEKQKISGKIIAIIKLNKSIDLINFAIFILNTNSINITNKGISEFSGLSVSTVKRNKNKPKNNLEIFKEICYINNN